MSLKLDIVAVGRLKAGPERDLCARYSERLQGISRALGFEGPRFLELPESQARRDLDRKAEEAGAILAAIPVGYKVMTFDEGGAMIDSAGFAARLVEWRDTGVPGASFVIGGADGLGDAIKARSTQAIAFGRMTMPHQIVRVLVLEQLYRGATILSGHPYHRV